MHRIIFIFLLALGFTFMEACGGSSGSNSFNDQSEFERQQKLAIERQERLANEEQLHLRNLQKHHEDTARNKNELKQEQEKTLEDTDKNKEKTVQENERRTKEFNEQDKNYLEKQEVQNKKDNKQASTKEQPGDQPPPSYQEKKEFFVFIGNPGVGKSTLLNNLLGEVEFKSGFASGTGMTQTMKMVETELDGKKIYLVDSPGLSDIKIREQAAQEIKKALSLDGNFHIFFVATIESGRIRPDDFATIKVVMDAINIDNKLFNIVINKLSDRTFNNINTDKMVRENFEIGYQIGVKPNAFYYLKRMEELEDQDNIILKDNLSLKNFKNWVLKTPSFYIDKNSVTDLNIKDLDKIKLQMETSLNRLKDLNGRLKEKSEEYVQMLSNTNKNKEELQQLINSKMQLIHPESETSKKTALLEEIRQLNESMTKLDESLEEKKNELNVLKEEQQQILKEAESKLIK